MNKIIEFEKFTVSVLDKIIRKIITDKLELNISAKSRAGAEISDYLERKFVEYSKNSNDIFNPESAPRGKTKNPWDARCNVRFKDISEEIWIDFKCIKKSAVDSNPDIGSPNKVINFIKNSNFYLIFILVYYVENGDTMRFVTHNDEYTKSYFLKDINHTFRRNPKNQLQVNINAEPEYRTRKDFIELLMKKIKESHYRQINISINALNGIEKNRKELISANQESMKKYL